MATAAPAAPTANRAELLAIADSVAREKLIDRGIVIEAMEDAIQRAARARYGAENDIRAKLDPNTGDLRLWRVLEVVEEVDDYFKQVDLKGAEKLQKGAAGKFVLCVGESMRADEDDEVTFANAVYRYKRTPLPEEVARVAGVVAGIS